MYIHNIADDIDNFCGEAMVNPNVVSGADLDRNMASGYYQYVRDEALIKLEEELKIASDKQNALVQKKQELVNTSNELFQKIRLGREQLTEMKAKLSGTYKGFTFSSPEEKSKMENDALLLQINLDTWQVTFDNIFSEIQKMEKDIYMAGQEVIRIKNEIQSLTKGEEITDPVKETTKETQNVSIAVSSRPIIASSSPKEDIVSQIGSKVGLNRNKTLFALGGIAVLGIVMLTKK